VQGIAKSPSFRMKKAHDDAAVRLASAAGRSGEPLEH